MNTRKGVNLSTRDYAGYRTDMINQLKAKIPEYSDFSSSDMGIVLIELLAYQLDSLSYYIDKITNELFLDTAYEKESVSRLARMLGYDMAESTPAKYLQVFEIIPQSQPYLIPKGFKITTEESLSEQVVVFETEEDLIIPEGCTGLEKDEEGNYLYSTVVVEGETISNEILGTGTDAKDQTFSLHYHPVIYGSVDLSVASPFGSVEWSHVNNFVSSDSQSPHYTLTLSEDGVATVKFGNGISGMIPESIEDGITVNYRIGGGEIGNVGINTITRMPQKLAVIKRTFNPFEAIEKGTDSESIDIVRVKAPASIGNKYGIVTLTDYKNLALSHKDVLRANSVVVGEEQTLVEIYYVLHPDANPSKVLDYLHNEYSERKMLGTRYRLIEAEQVPLDLEVTAKLYSHANKHSVIEKIHAYFKDKIQAGSYDFLETPEPSDYIYDLLQIDGVRSAYVEFPNEILLDNNQIITLGNVEVNVSMEGGRVR